jgi:hypothetical protein
VRVYSTIKVKNQEPPRNGRRIHRKNLNHIHHPLFKGND